MSDFKDPGKIDIQKNALQISFDGKGILSTILRGLYDLSTGKWGSGTAPELLKAIKIKAGPNREAFFLVVNALIGGCREQIRQEIEQVHIDENEKFIYKKREINTEAFQQLKDTIYQFDAKDLTKPETLLLLQDFKEYYKNWLKETFGMSDTRARSLAAEYPFFFGYAFYEELRSAHYGDLLSWANNPLLEQQRRLMQRHKYRAGLKAEYNRPALGEQDIALSDVYIAPDLWVFDGHLEKQKCEVLKAKHKLGKNDHFVPIDYNYSIHDYFNNYFLKGKRSTFIDSDRECSRMLILLGQPGHGKSSFCYRTAYDLLNRDTFPGQVYLVRLQKADRKVILDPSKELGNMLPDHLEAEKNWKSGAHQTVLLLDGLDELYMSQGLSDSEVNEFLLGCQRMVEAYDKLFLVVTSRFNYIETSRLNQRQTLILSLGTLSLPQQIDLIQKFEKQKKKKVNIDLELLEKINKENNHAHIKELIELPILLQMILISEIDLKQIDSRAQIYQRLFKEVLDRKWATDGRLKKYRRDNFEPSDLRNYLAFLAFKIFQSEKNYLNRKEIEGYKETRDFARKFLSIEHGRDEFGKIIKDVLTSFYLKERRKDEGDDQGEENKHYYAIEFLHKSLYEYLCCEHIWQKVKSLFLENGQAKYLDFEDIGEDLQRLFAHTRLSSETVTYLKEIINQDTVDHQQLQMAMAHSLPELLKHGFIFQYPLRDEPSLQRFPTDQQVLHIFHGYWMILGQLNLYTLGVYSFFGIEWTDFIKKYQHTINEKECLEQYINENKELLKGIGKRIIILNPEQAKIDIVENLKRFPKWLTAQVKESGHAQVQSFEIWLRRFLFRQFYWEKFSVIWEVPRWENETFIRYLRMYGADRLPNSLPLPFAKLESVDLRSWFGQSAILIGADLSNADLSNADLSNAYLRYADLRNADLSNADLRNADLRNADLRNADLSNADLRNADLRNADLRNADLSNADLRNADLSNADLSNAYLSYADLSYADLSYADLRNAYLRYADLSYADLSYADLSYADLRNADLRNADLSYADLRYAVLHSPNWMEELSTISQEWVSSNYVVDPEKKIHSRIYGEMEGYLIRAKKSEEKD